MHWRNFHIHRLVYFFPSFLVVFRICFLILICIYLLYLCCSIGPSHSVWWSLWKNSVNAAVGGVGLLIGPRALKTLNSVEKIQPRMMAATFNGNPRATIISCYSPTNVSEETELVTFYDELSSLVRSIPKHNMLVIGRDMNAQIGKNENNKYSLHNTSNRNGQHLTDFIIENRLACLNTNYQKREGKLWTYTYANNTKAQIDYVLINKKWKNSALNCEAYSSFEGMSTDHRIVTAKIRLSLRKNAKRTATTKHYDWALLNNICLHKFFKILITSCCIPEPRMFRYTSTYKLVVCRKVLRIDWYYIDGSHKRSPYVYHLLL